MADLARSVVMLVDRSVINGFPDPGGPGHDDRETVILKSGPSAGRPWQRKPRLQVRMGPGLEPELIRKALALALALDSREARLEPVGKPFGKRTDTETTKVIEGLQGDIFRLEAAAERLRSVIETLAFSPLAGGVETRADALHILGFGPGERPDRKAVRTRFRQLATIHHPDGETGSHQRMTQLNEAMAILRNDPI
ncbi:MAG: J domain-containing protein [Magnetovibrionaceae bacterium]